MNLDDLFFEMKKRDEKEEIQLSFYVINYCIEHKYEITNLKLHGKPLFQEKFKAWRHGPVLQSVYNYFCIGIVRPKEKEIKISKDKKEIIDSVLEKKASCSAFSLVEETHIKKWSLVYSI